MTRTTAEVEKTVSECYEKHYQALYKYCMVRLGSLNEHAEDCVQEAFLVLQKRLKEGETILQLRPFLYKTVGNFIARTIKQYNLTSRRTINIEDAESIASPPIIPDDFDYDKFAAVIISLLTPEEQELYKMKYAENKTLSKIAEKLKITPSAAAMRTSRLRQKIKDLIKQQNLFENEVIP